MKETTIAAISTAYGEAGIGLAVLRKVFVPHVCRKSRDAAAGFDYMPRHMYYGQAVAADGSAIDECLAVYMPGPYSYTGEDVVELQCHGSGISYKKVYPLSLMPALFAREPPPLTMSVDALSTSRRPPSRFMP